VTTWDSGNVRIYEDSNRLIAIRVFVGGTVTNTAERRLTAPMARYLADRLYQLASRAERRPA
jgi:hypothetical protein